MSAHSAYPPNHWHVFITEEWIELTKPLAVFY